MQQGRHSLVHNNTRFGHEVTLIEHSLLLRKDLRLQLRQAIPIITITSDEYATIDR
jgi:hypothetical protein